MVPPPVIATNRAVLAALVATNILGQNTPAIAATETHYAEMWAQDAAGMYAYAGSSSTASQLTSFIEPPQTTNATAAVVQPAATTASPSVSGAINQLVALIESIPTWLHTLATNITSLPTDASSFFEGLAIPNLITIPPVPPALTTDLVKLEHLFLGNHPRSPIRSRGWLPYLVARSCRSARCTPTPKTGRVSPLSARLKPVSGALAPLTGGGYITPKLRELRCGACIGIHLGRAALVGSMSVPQGWTEAAPGIKTLASVLPMNMAATPAASLAGEGGVFSQMALSSLAGRALTAGSFSSLWEVPRQPHSAVWSPQPTPPRPRSS